MDLAPHLHKHFGFREFRPNQQAVCQAAIDGRDVLLVMPTGAGKSLCYQLPGLVRGGTTLVLSPLIALMDDQAAKLTAAGHRVARIHSGIDRDTSRQSCRDYLEGRLDFLFIAPERLRVPGFPEMLAKRKPSLIAIDEAHCISGWGHDFRPDYRTLGDHLPALRPAPVIALTATATPTVQHDIVAQLRLTDPACFIHGFRRTNLAIEVVELPKSQRTSFVQKLLRGPGSRPAIVYAPSRKLAEEVAGTLGSRAAAYHAGLDPATRERVQRHFLSGELEVVVATIAFGMGVDKADIRTVIHTAMPASVEGYYQEIGRAGRDGLPSRTVLLHSFADRKVHEFFLERDYPPATDLARVLAALTPDPQLPPDLARKLRLDPETLGRAVEKLASQGAATFDIEGGIRLSSSRHANWRPGYEAQLSFRRSQIDRMTAFTQGADCRMLALIRHFGDTADAREPCGHCDICAPHAAAAVQFRPPTDDETDALRRILRTLAGRGRSVGRLFTELSEGRLKHQIPDRRALDDLLDALARAAYLTLADDTFVNPEGKQVTYRKATLTYEGDEAANTPTAVLANILLRDTGDIPATGTRSPRKSARGAAANTSKSDQPLSPAEQTRFEHLRAWRKALAASTGKPAFIILGDAVLRALSVAAPTTLTELSTVSGIGPDKRDRYGADILATLRNGALSSPTTVPATQKPEPPASSAPPPKPSSRPEREARSGETPVFRYSTPPQPPVPQLPASLTPTQSALATRLRSWREAQAEALARPQFFILGSSTLHRIAAEQPQTLPDLARIEGLTRDQLTRFGPDLLTLCTQPQTP